MNKVHLIGAENLNWAIDEDYRLIKNALDGVVKFTGLSSAKIVHSAYWQKIVETPAEKLAGKFVICHVDNAPYFYIRQPKFIKVQNLVDLWIARSTEAVRQLESLGLNARLVPFTVDTGIFKEADVAGFRAEHSIPEDAYLIGNFHRDTEGGDLCSPKIQKGPDIFFEIVKEAHRRNPKIHVLLAGPRRFWLRKHLKEEGIPFTYIGKETDGDDMKTNVLSRQELNRLYNTLDLYIVSSRWEGGPHSIMESAATRCNILSTRVGLAEDILEPECIYDDLAQAVELVLRDMEEGFLGQYREKHFETVQGRYSPEQLRMQFQQLYRANFTPTPKRYHPAERPRKFFGLAEGHVRKVAFLEEHPFFTRLGEELARTGLKITPEAQAEVVITSNAEAGFNRKKRCILFVESSEFSGRINPYQLVVCSSVEVLTALQQKGILNKNGVVIPCETADSMQWPALSMREIANKYKALFECEL